MKFDLVEVPPPKEVPVDQISETLGLLPGLKAEKSEGGWRCAHCSCWQKDKGWMVWVPDSVRASDSAEAISDQCRRNAYNGCGSGWCLKCALALGKPIRSGLRGLLSIFDPL
jgi:hypothetical protein